MTVQEWTAYLQAMQESAQSTAALLLTHCVACWYEQHRDPFPAQDSSSLCPAHAAALRADRKQGATSYESANSPRSLITPSSIAHV